MFVSSIKKGFYFGIFLLLPLVGVQAQQARVVVQNATGTGTKPSINVKWYSQQFVYNDGVFVYRRDYPKGRWKKITPQPLKRLPDVAPELKQKDEELNVFVEVMKEAKPEHLTGLLLMNLMVESFNSHVFSNFLGIQYTDADVVPGKTYQYKVQKVYGTDELFMAQSDSITAGSFAKDAAPANFFARIAKKKVQIGWEANDTRFYAVNVYRKQNGMEAKLNNRPVLLTQVPDSIGKLVYPEVKFTDDSIAEGATYQYCIAGVDFFGNETKRTATAEIKFPDQTPPPAPENFQLNVKKYSVDLTWNVVTAPDLKGFYVYRSTNDKTYQRLTETPLGKNKNQFADNVPRNGGYYYFVSAVDNAGNETPSLRQFKDIRDVFPPSKPVGLTAVADTGRIFLSWKANTEPDLMGYLIFRQTVTKKKFDSDFVLLNANPIKQTLFENSLPKNTKNKFLYRIVAIDSSYNKSEYSNIAGANMPDVVKPDKPYIKNVSVNNDYVTVEWVANADADLKGYNLFSRPVKDEASPFKMVNANLISATTTRYTDKWATPNTPYTYYLVAVDSIGNESEPSEQFEAFFQVKSNKSISQASNLKIKKIDNAIEIECQLAVSPNFVGCVLFRGNDPNSLKPVSGMQQTGKFTDTPGNSPETFYYQVKVYDKDGVKSESEQVKFENTK